MTTRRTTPARELATLLPPLALLLALLQVAAQHGAGHRELALAGVTVALTQVLPGALVWRLVRPENGWLVEDLGLGLAIGAALAVPCHVLGVATGLHWLDIVLPLGVVAVVLGTPASRRRVVSRRTGPLPWLWGAAVTACSLVPMLATLQGFRSPLRWHGWAVTYVDLPYHNALAGEAMHRFPPHYPQAALEPLNYHWFAHAWTAQISTVSGTPLEVLLWRFNPSVLVVAVPLLTALAAMRLSGRTWVGPAAAALAFLLLDVAPWAQSAMTTPLHTPMSPTQQFGVLIVVSLLVLIALRWRDLAPRGSVVLLVLLLVIAGGAKGSTLPVLVAGGLLACLGLLLSRDRARLRVVGVDTALAIVVMLTLNQFMFGGGAGGVSLDPSGRDFVLGRGALLLGSGFEPASPTGIAAGLLALLTIVLGHLGVLGLLVERGDRVAPLAWLLVGCALSGIGAVLFLTHPGNAQWYFYKSAEPAFAIGAAWGTAALLSRAGSKPRLFWLGSASGVTALGLTHLVFVRGHDGAPGLGTAALALAVLAALLAGGAWLVARGGGRHAVAAALAVAVGAAGAVPAAEAVVGWSPPESKVSARPSVAATHSDDVRALQWLRDHSDPHDLVATNLHCRGRITDACDRRRFVVASYSERGVLVEGWTYTREASKSYGERGSSHLSESTFWDPQLLALNDGFITQPSASAAGELYDLGVRWVVVWHRAPHAEDLAPFARLVHRSRNLSIHQLRPADR